MGVRALVLAPLLGPAAFGVWALFRLGVRYAMFAALGVNRGLEREAVRERVGAVAAADPVEASRAAVGFNLLVFGTLALALLVASGFTSNPTTVLALRGLGAAVLGNQLTVYALVQLRASGKLRSYAKVEVALAWLHLVFSGGLAWRWGLAGAITGFVCADLVALALVVRQVPFRPSLSRPAIRRLLAVGFPVMLAGATSIALATADRLVVAAVAGTVVLGYYAFAASIGGLASSAAWVIRTVILPDVYSYAARAGTRPAVRHHLEATVLPFAILFPLLLGFAALGIGPSVLLLLPRFAEAVPPARIFIFTGVTFGLTTLGALAVVAADRQRRLPFLSAAALVVNVGASWAVLRAGGGLQGVAAGALFSQGLYAAAVLDVGASAAGLERRRFLFSALGPLVWCVAVVFALGLLLPGSDAATALLSAGLFAVLLLPLYPRAWAQAKSLRRARA